MSLLDIAIMFLVVLGVWRGYQAGMIKTLSSLCAWLFALIVASRMAKVLSVFFVDFIDNSILQIALAFVVIVLFVVMAVHLVAGSILKTIRFLKLGFLDRLAGGILGAMTATLKVLFVLSVAAPLLVRMPIWQESGLAQSLLPYAPVAQTLLKKAFGEAWNQLENPYQ